MNCGALPGNYFGERPYSVSAEVLYDLDAVNCRAWMFCYCQHDLYGWYARLKCAKTCHELEVDTELDHELCLFIL